MQWHHFIMQINPNPPKPTSNYLDHDWAKGVLNLNSVSMASLGFFFFFPSPHFFTMWQFGGKRLLRRILLANMYQLVLLMSIQGAAARGACCVCTLRSSNQSSEFIYRVCVQACTQATIIPMDAPDVPPPPLRQVYLRHVCQSRSIHIPNLSFLHPAHPHDTHTAPFLFIILLLCNCLDDNALHIMAMVALWMKPMATICLHGVTPCPAEYH